MSKKSKPEILVCGRSTVDIIMQVDGFTDQPVKRPATDLALTVGGPAANAAIAIARHGGAVQLRTGIGSDMFGDYLAGRLAAENVTLLGESRQTDAASSLSIAFIDRAGERQTVNYGGSGFALDERLPDTLAADIVLADNRHPELARMATEFARRKNIPAVMDAEAPFAAQDAVNASHIAFSMQGFRSYMPGNPEVSFEDSLGAARAGLGCWLCVTDGINGVWVADGNSVYNIPAFSVKAVDSVGAGDVWHGVFALRLGEGADEAEAVRFANAAAALKCTGFGGIDACPDRQATESFMAEAGQ